MRSSVFKTHRRTLIICWSMLASFLTCLQIFRFYPRRSLSLARPNFKASPPVATQGTGMALSNFLSDNKKRFLEDLEKDGGKEWTVVMGNEAGDLDSIASSIAYSFFAPSTPHGTPNRTIALLQTPRSDLQLRAENTLAYQYANLLPDHSDLFCIDDLPSSNPPSSLQSNFALVDHNKLIKPWGDDDGKPVHGKVVALIDHHADEGLYKDTADPREIIMPVGSCASLVTDHFKDAWSGLVPPPELATLLLSAIMIDTQGLKSGGKAEPKDHEAVAFLIPHSPFNPSVNDTQVTAPFAPSADHPIPSGLADFSEQLSTTKFSISHLSSEDLLRRDYKQYEFGSKSNVRVGLSTVPYDLEEWIVKDPELIASVRNWAKKKSLAVAGVLTSFHNKKGHHRRQMLVLIMAENRAAIEEKLFNGLEADETMGLKKFKGFLSKSDDKNEEGDAVAVWKQGDAKASRKQIAPAFKAILDTL